MELDAISRCQKHVCAFYDISLFHSSLFKTEITPGICHIENEI